MSLRLKINLLFLLGAVLLSIIGISSTPLTNVLSEEMIDIYFSEKYKIALSIVLMLGIVFSIINPVLTSLVRALKAEVPTEEMLERAGKSISFLPKGFILMVVASLLIGPLLTMVQLNLTMKFLIIRNLMAVPLALITTLPIYFYLVYVLEKNTKKLGMIPKYRPLSLKSKIFMLTAFSAISIFTTTAMVGYIAMENAFRDEVIKKSIVQQINLKELKEIVNSSGDEQDVREQIMDQIEFEEFGREQLSSLTFKNLILFFIISAVAGICFVTLSRTSLSHLIEMRDRLKDMSEKDADLTKRIIVNSKDEIGESAYYFNLFVAKISTLISNIFKAENNVNETMYKIFGMTRQSTNNIASISSTASMLGKEAENNLGDIHSQLLNIETLAQKAIDVSKSMKGIIKESLVSKSNVESGNKYLNQIQDNMLEIESTVKESSIIISELGNFSKQIQNITETIKSIAGQTNLLSLNASIEAAKAGDAGKGFAVVASEIKKLADTSIKSVRDIEDIIKNVVEKLDNSISKMEQNFSNINEGIKFVENIGTVIETTSSNVSDIAKRLFAVDEFISKQTESFSEITDLIQKASSVIEKQTISSVDIFDRMGTESKIMESITGELEMLSAVSSELNMLVKQFRL